MASMTGLRRLLSRRTTVINYELARDPVVLNADIAEIYRTQSNIRSVVTFLADNLAELPIHIYERTGDNDRRRVTDSTAALLLKRPNSAMTRYELMRATASSILLYDRVFWMVYPAQDAPSGWEVVPIPTPWITRYNGDGIMEPESIDVTNSTTGATVRIPMDALLHFHGWDPSSLINGCSPIEALRNTLAEQIEADRFRAQVWKNGGRVNAYITRPAEVQPWTPEQAETWAQAFKAAWTGRGSKAGGMPVLEDGMRIESVEFNAKESQWAEAKQLSREEAAGLWHVNPSLIWHTQTQTYASAKDNARALYSETMGPTLAFLSERINEFLLPMIGEPAANYAEFNIMKKLQGSFEEQAQLLTAAVGGPWMVRNEARARWNLPAIEGGDELITPLNVALGGAGYVDQYQLSAQPQAKSAAIPPAPPAPVKDASVRMKSHPDDETQDAFVAIYQDFTKRQARVVLSNLGASDDKADVPTWWDAERWDRELADDLEKQSLVSSEEYAARFLERMGLPADAYSVDRTRKYLRAMADGRARNANKRTLEELEKAIDEGKDAQEVFDAAENRGKLAGLAMAGAVVGFAMMETVSQAKDNGYAANGATKTWIVTSGNPRPSHAALDGETVGYDDTFSNGAEWPGDTGALDADEVCGCQCEVEITIP